MEGKLYYSFRKVLLDKLNNGKPMAEGPKSFAPRSTRLGGVAEQVLYLEVKLKSWPLKLGG